MPFSFGRDDMAMAAHRFVSSFGPEGALDCPERAQIDKNKVETI